jgi:hypothetical protein
MVLTPSDSGRDRETAHGNWAGQSVEYFPRRVIVKFSAPADEASLAAVAEQCARVADSIDGATVTRPPGPTGRAVLDVGEGADALALIDSISDREDVEFAELDVVDHAAVIPNDTRYPEQWALPKVNAPDAWDLETGKTTVVIGVIDSGISTSGAGSLDHPDLNDTSRIVLGTDFVDGGTPRDLNGHGTHVAGIAAAVGNNVDGVAGMNWGSRVYICRTLDTNGNGSSADFADAVEEITDYAVANGLKAVINYSGGGPPNQTKLDACNYASSRGMILCAATGNDNAGPVIWPAAYSTTVAGVIAVGSTDSADNVSGFSNVGPEVTVVAPGSGILSTMPTYTVTIPAGVNYGTLDGTSMATPLVTGLVALMWSKNNGKTNASIKQCLIDSAVKLGAGSFHNSWGNGRVDAEAALKCVEPIIVLSKINICQPSVISPCIPVSRLTGCVPLSRLPHLCRVSRLPLLCPVDSRIARCVPVPPLSAIDACPSALGPLCGGGVGSAIECVVQPPSGELIGPIERRRTSAEYAFVDDEGTTHIWQPQAEAGAEVWEGQGGQYFWIDDDGRYHEWRG